MHAFASRCPAARLQDWRDETGRPDVGLVSESPGSPVPTDFDRTTTPVPVEGAPGQFSVELDGGWSSLVGVHGGYMCAVVVRGAETLTPGRTLRTISTSFLRTGKVGPATLTVREVRQGRTITTMVGDLSQDGRLLITSRLTLLVPQVGWEQNNPQTIDLPAPTACVRFERPGQVSHFSQVDSAFDPERMPFSGDRAHVSGYLRPLEPRPVDAPWLVMASDWFPPPAVALVEPPTGGVSIDLTTHIHRAGGLLGRDDWLVGTFGIEDSTGGLAVEHGRITLMDGTMVAESFQTRLTTQR
jgi:acyl-CoA thioesterase